jgi:hypothetical protein
MNNAEGAEPRPKAAAPETTRAHAAALWLGLVYPLRTPTDLER